MDSQKTPIPNEILNQEFFDTIKNSKKINIKSQKIKELSKYFSHNQDNPLPVEIKNQLPDLYDLLLINLNENNNNYVLAQMELIQILVKIIKNEDKFNSFIKESLPKLFDKFYLGNEKINETLVKMFSEFITSNILTIKDFYQHIENIPLEEEDNYRINILNFLYENIDTDKSVLLSNIPKSLNELIKKLANDNDSDISETASKILNILINRDMEEKKKKESNINLSNTDEKNREDKGGTGISSFVNNIVTAIKQNVDNVDINENKDNNIDNYNKDNNINHSERKTENKNDIDNNENIKAKEEIKDVTNFEIKDENSNKEEKSNIEDKKENENGEMNNEEKKIENENKKEEDNCDKKEEVEIIKDNEQKKGEGEVPNVENNNIKEDIKNNEAEEEAKEEIKGEIKEEIKEETKEEETKEEEKGEKKDEIKEERKEEEKDETKEEKKEEKKEDKKEEKKEEKKDAKPEEIKTEIKEEKKEEKKEETKEEKNDEIKNPKTEEIQKEEKEINDKESSQKEEVKDDKTDEQKDNTEKDDLTKTEPQKIEEKSTTKDIENMKEIAEEKKEEVPKNSLETKSEENQIQNTENIKDKNDNNDKKEEKPINNDNESNEKKKEENKTENREETKKSEIIKESTQKEENNNITKEEKKLDKEEPLPEKKELKEEEPKKEITEEKPKEEIQSKENKKVDIKEENKENKIEQNDTNKKEEKKENTEKNNENENKTKNTMGKKKSGGIKSKISKFRKNKNKNKDGGFDFELVMDKKKETPIEQDQSKIQEKEKEQIKEEVSKEEKKVEEKPKEVIPNEEKKVVEEKKEEIKTEKKEEVKTEVKEETKEEKKEKEIETNNIKEEAKEQKKEEIIKEKPKEEIKKLDTIKEEKLEEETHIKEQPPKDKDKDKDKNKEITKPEKESKPSSSLETNQPQENNNNPQSQEQTQEKPENKVDINKESCDDFKKILEHALEKEEKEKNNPENISDTNPTPVKQKKEDPKFDEIKTVLGKEIIEALFSPKWEVKKHGFELINEFIESKPKESYNLNDLIEYMKLKLKAYKETNFNINREAINVYITMIKKKIIQKEPLTNIIIAYHEKLSDSKLKDNLVELIKNSFDIIEPSNILKQIITKISKKNNAKLLIEYSTFFGNVVEEYDVKDLPNKDIIDFCKVLANNSNPQVRTSAISLLCILYKYLGKDVKSLTRDIKESTLKLIDAELDKVQVIDPKTSTNKKKAASVIENTNNKTGGNKTKDLIPPQDISKKITPQIIKLLSSGQWAEKKEACDTIEKILISANMRILPNGLNTLMTNIKKKLSDSNKNFVKMLVALLSKLIEAMKSGFKQWAKPIALTLIPNLADKNTLLRTECQNCFDKWVEFAGFESLVIHFPDFLKQDNVEMRIEIMNFFKRYKNKFNKSIGESVYKEMVNPLLICLQDRSSNVRNLAEEIIKISLGYIPLSNYYKKIGDFKPAIAKTLNQILDKIKLETSANEPQAESALNSEQETNSTIPHLNTEQNSISPPLNKTSEKPSKNTMPKTSGKKLTIQTSEASLKTESSIQDESERNESTTEDNISNFTTGTNLNKSTKKQEKDSNNKTTKKINSSIKNKQKPKRKLSEDDLVNPLGTAMNKTMPASNVDHLASVSTILRKKENKSFQKNPSQVVKPTNAVFLLNVKVIPTKAKRYDKDKKTKFNLETLNKDYFIKLKEQCKGLFTEIFAKKIFSDDFRKQVEAFKDMKGQIDKKINIPIYLDNLDLILKIIGIKILNNLNPTLMKNFFEFLDSLYQVLIENKYKTNDTEANIIISLLIDKLSLNNNTLREHLLLLLNKYIEYMDTNKIMVTVINIALNKNNKIKTDILDLTIDLVSQDKLNISTKTYAKLLCRFLPFYENVIRTKTLSLFQEIYNNIREELWNMIEISEKDKEFLEENLCVDDNEEEEREEDDEQENEVINTEIENKEKIEDKNEINLNEKNETSEENKKDNKDSEKGKIITNKNGFLTKEDLDNILDNLLMDDQSEKLNAIILLHENVCGKFDQNKSVLIPNIDKIITKFKTVSHKTFYITDLKDIPTKFAKYLAIVFCKLASNKELISHLSYNVLVDICRELLNYLLIKDLDKIGVQQEGNIIFKSINSTMLRLLENCDITFVITALLELIKEFYEKDEINLVNLAIKCLLKTTHNLSENINNIQIHKILLQMHLLLLCLQKNNNKDLTKRTQSSALIINTVKNIVSEFVKLKKEKILEEYSKSVKNHQFNDKYLLKWIKASLGNV